MYTLHPFATSSGAASFAEQFASGPVCVLLQSLAKPVGSKRYTLWLNVATLDADSDGVHFDVKPVKQIAPAVSSHKSHAELRSILKGVSHA
jgi:hypothetical protein